VVHWSVRDPRGRAYPGMPVIIPRLSTGCPKISDHEGYVLFAVEKTAGTCSDSDASLSNNFYSVLPLSPAGYSCSFTTPRLEKFKACTSSGDAVGFVTATCSYVAPRTIGTSTSYTVQVILEDGRGASAVTFYGTENIGNLANRYPDSTGRWSFWRIAGYHVSRDLTHYSAILALDNAIRFMGDVKGTIHHSDRGCQYCCHEFLKYLGEHNMLSSMTDDCHCYQNAIAERVNGILKDEFNLDAVFETFKELQLAVAKAIFVYNTKRTHWSLGLKTPEQVYKEAA